MKLTIACLFVVMSYMVVAGHQAFEFCPVYWTGFQGSCYRLFLRRKTWQEAENHCVELGGHLTSVLSEAENNFLYNYWRSTVSTPAWGFWIGYNDVNTEGTWVWTDQSTSTAPYTNWRSGQPDNAGGTQDYGRMWYYGTGSDTNRDWDDEWSGTRGSYICKKIH